MRFCVLELHPIIDKRLYDSTFRVLAYIALIGTVPTTYQELADDMGMKYHQVTCHIGLLRKYGYLRWLKLDNDQVIFTALTKESAK